MKIVPIKYGLTRAIHPVAPMQAVWEPVSTALDVSMCESWINPETGESQPCPHGFKFVWWKSK